MHVPALRTVSKPEGVEYAFAGIPRALEGYVDSWVGYTERRLGAFRRRQLPNSMIVVIVEFGPPIRVYEGGSETLWATHDQGFVAGLTQRFTLTEHDGCQAGIELRLTPLGARSIFRLPLSLMAERVLPLRELLPGSYHSLCERLASCVDWPSRFHIMQEVLTERIRGSRRACAKIEWALARIRTADGDVAVQALANELGCSRKHLAALFREGVGFTPKAYASIVRFERLIEEVKVDRTLCWAAAAARFGYADQAHLVREVKRYSGLTPAELIKTLR